MSSEFVNGIYLAFKWPLGDEQTKRYEPGYRDVAIITHYSREVDRRHMDIITAHERCLGDIAGQNRFPGKVQRQ